MIRVRADGRRQCCRAPPPVQIAENYTRRLWWLLQYQIVLLYYKYIYIGISYIMHDTKRRRPPPAGHKGVWSCGNATTVGYLQWKNARISFIHAPRLFVDIMTYNILSSRVYIWCTRMKYICHIIHRYILYMKTMQIFLYTINTHAYWWIFSKIL